MATSHFWPNCVHWSPDPLIPEVERHVLACSVDGVPADLPACPSARTRIPGRRGRAWSGLDHRLTRAGLGQGPARITVLAAALRRLPSGELEVEFEAGDGIVDGRRDYEALVALRGQRGAGALAHATVEFDILTGPGRPSARVIADQLSAPSPRRPSPTREGEGEGEVRS